MRAKEILKEEEQLDAYHRAAMANAMTFPGMDQYYELYRFQMLLASAGPGGLEQDATNVLRDKPLTNSYTDAEDDMIKQVAKTMNKEIKVLSTGKYEEPDGTNTASPVASRKELWDLYKK